MMSEPRDQARQYARIRYRLLLIDLALSWICLGAMQWSGFSERLARWWSGWLASELLVILGYLAVFGALSYLATLPLRFYGGFLLEHRFGLSRLTMAGWCYREIKHVMVGAILSGALIEGLYALLRRFPDQWPLFATAGWVLVSVILARVFPTVLLPIFYKTSPVEDEQLVRRLVELCERVGLKALGVFRFNLGAETRKANAALAGLGKTRRVLLSDTLMTDFPVDEIESVLAHELGHQRHRHITKMLILSALGSWVAFSLTKTIAPWWIAGLGLRGLDDIAGFPVLMLWLSILGMVSLPLQNGVSRYFEWQADRFAIAMATSPQVFAKALRRLGTLNLADPKPPRWVVWLFYDHPPIAERVQVAERGG